MAKSIIPKIDPKIKKQILTSPYQIPTQVNNRAIVDLIIQINQKLENRSGFYFYNVRPVGGVLRAKFYLEKSTFQSTLFVSESGGATIIGNWIWLIMDGAEYKLIVSKAQATTLENKIPESNSAFQILSNSGESLSENRVQSSNFDWKNAKVNEGLFNGTKGFFVGKGALNNFCLNMPDTDGLQLELWQLPDGSPVLYFSRVWGDKRNINTFGSTTTVTVLIDDGEGMAGSRPCPPYSN
jgi:hypothetical protein